jgi:CheY-like chemotaxis protein
MVYRKKRKWRFAFLTFHIVNICRICKKLIEIMGGTMRVKSSTAIGTSGSWFYFTLPYKPVSHTMDDVVAPNKEPEKTGIKIRSRQRTTTTILLAEDDLVSRQIARRMLEKAGCTVLKACDGAQAVTLFEQYRDTIDLILMDVMMPNMDGLEATGKIRDIERTSSSPSSSSSTSLESVPIVALSAGAMRGDRERGLQVGMSDYLYKPVSNAAIGTMLEKYVGRYENHGLHKDDTARENNGAVKKRSSRCPKRARDM